MAPLRGKRKRRRSSSLGTAGSGSWGFDAVNGQFLPAGFSDWGAQEHEGLKLIRLDRKGRRWRERGAACRTSAMTRNSTDVLRAIVGDRRGVRTRNERTCEVWGAILREARADPRCARRELQLRADRAGRRAEGDVRAPDDVRWSSLSVAGARQELCAIARHEQGLAFISGPTGPLLTLSQWHMGRSAAERRHVGLGRLMQWCPGGNSDLSRRIR